MKTKLPALLALAWSLLVTSGAVALEGQNGSAHDFTFTSIDEKTPLPLADWRGKVVLVVNTASFCGFTKQYDGLEKLWESYRDKGLVVLGVPSNDFGEQEPGSASEIKSFCEGSFGISFPLADKVPVTGDKAHPFYRWVAEITDGKGVPRWNFHKLLIDREGRLVNWFASSVKPGSSELIGAIERELAAPPAGAEKRS